MRRVQILFPLILALAVLVVVIGVGKAPAAERQAQLPTPIPEFADGRVVVRAYFSDPKMVADLASWKEPWEVNDREGYVVVDVDQSEYLLLQQAGFRLEIDEAKTAELNAPHFMLPGQGGGIPGFPCYRTVEETFQSALDIVAAYPDLATWTDIGDSWDKTAGMVGYDLQVLRLTNASSPGPKPKMFAMAAIHAREYTTVELVTRFAEYLVENYDLDPDITWILDNHEIHLLLITNPDGRKHAEAGAFWRKNTNQNYCSPTSPDRGADLNRNFQFGWNCCGGSSSNECAETYHGAFPVSEPETEAVQDYVLSQYADLRDPAIGAAAPLTTTGLFFDIHSYSELVLWPWGFTEDPTGNATQLQTLGRKFAYFNGYYPEQAIGLYPTDGTTDDFAYGELGLPAYTFELGTTFFQSCSVFENTILPDNLDALLYAAKVTREPYLAPAGPDALAPALDVQAVPAGTPVSLTVTLNDARFNNSNGAEPVQAIATGEFYIDVPYWITTTTPIAYPLGPSDGTFNTSIEAAEALIDTSGLALGRHTIYIRGRDSADNWGAIGAVFLEIIDPNVAPSAAFTSSSPDLIGTTTAFTNTSTGTSLSFEWDLGDGSGTITETNPVHAYAAAGIYTVTLTAANILGSDTVTGTVEILLEPAPVFTLYLPISQRDD